MHLIKSSFAEKSCASFRIMYKRECVLKENIASIPGLELETFVSMELRSGGKRLDKVLRKCEELEAKIDRTVLCLDAFYIYKALADTDFHGHGFGDTVPNSSKQFEESCEYIISHAPALITGKMEM